MRLQLINTVAGGPLGGTQDFGKVEFLGATWIPTFELGQGILLDARAGVGFGYDDTKRLPFAEQFFLGGPNTVRGYDYRMVGPVDMGEPLRDPFGGTFRDENGNPRYRSFPTFEPREVRLTPCLLRSISIVSLSRCVSQPSTMEVS